MARSVAEIKKTMTDAFLADETLREKYGLKDGATWSESFSNVSLENILLFIVAGATHVLEVIMDRYKAEVSKKVESAVVASVPWYHKMALDYQKGDALVLNESTMEYEYAQKNEAKQIVKYAAVRDRGTSVEILVSGDNGGEPSALSNDDLTPFKAYMNRIKVAGVILAISSRETDSVRIFAKVWTDPLLIDGDGKSVSDGNSKPVENAIEEFLKSIVYGGVLNKTKLVDAIQEVEGVEDVELGDCLYTTDGKEWKTITGNNYQGMSGSYKADGLENTLSYVV